jgi:hypothetical protein
MITKELRAKFKEERTIRIKKLRQDMDEIQVLIAREIQQRELNNYEDERTLQLARQHIQEARMWLGMNLQAIGEAYPYPNGKDVSNAFVDKPVDVYTVNSNGINTSC